MSKRCWESGSFVIPTKHWATIKKALREAYNQALARDLELVQRVYDAVKAANKGKRNVDWRTAVSNEVHRTEKAAYSRFDATRDVYDFKVIEDYQVVNALTVKDGEGLDAKVKLRALQKKLFPAATSKTVQFSAGGEGTISFDDGKRKLRWHVSENNHAVEAARDSYMGSAFFRELEKVVWGRGSGGVLTGNDEYNEDSDAAGAGANYITLSKGPLGDDEYERVNGWRPSRSRSAARPMRRF